MVKIDLRGIRVFVEVFTQSGKQRIEIDRGRLENNLFDSLVFSGNTMILEGENPMVIPFSAVYIRVQDLTGMLAEIVGDRIYVEGLSAIPEGKEREVLERLLVGSSTVKLSSAGTTEMITPESLVEAGTSWLEKG